MTADCIFCKIARKEIPATVVAETDQWVVFRDINPQAPTHLLIVPRRHVPSVNDLSDADRDLVGVLLLAARTLAEKEGIAGSGYRVVVNTNADAGQSVPHLHLHLLGGRRMRWPPG
jgi:histidine triad (HIT) family protein